MGCTDGGLLNIAKAILQLAAAWREQNEVEREKLEFEKLKNSWG